MALLHVWIPMGTEMSKQEWSTSTTRAATNNSPGSTASDAQPPQPLSSQRLEGASPGEDRGVAPGPRRREQEPETTSPHQAPVA